MKKITKLFILLLLTTAGFPTNSQAETYPATAPYGYELVEDASTLQAGDVIIIRQASGNNYLKINNTRTTNASMATNFVLEDAGTGNSSDFYLKAEGTENYLKAAAASGTMASTTNVSEKGVFNIKIASASGSSPETTIGFANFKGGDQDHVIRLITTSTSDNTSRIWYNSNGWAYGTGGGHWTGFYAFKKQDNVSGQVATLSYNDIEIYKDGNKVTPGSGYSYNHQVRSTSSPLITVTIGSGDVVYNTSMFTFGNGNKTYTIAIEDGYFITGFTINYTTGSGVTFSSNGVTSSDNGQLAVTGLLNTTSTTFDVSGTSNAWKSYYVMSIEVTYEDAATSQIASNGIQYGTDEAFNLQTEYGLVKDASNIVSNYKAGSEGTYEGLLDGTYTTYFHSAYGTVNSTANHNLTFTLDNNQTVDEFYFYMKKRSQNNANRPTAITVEGSNDGSTWTAIGNVTISGVSAAQNDNVKDYFSAKLGTAGTSYSQIRFTVTATNNGAKDNSNHVFFTASEWYILPANTCTDEFFAAAKTLRETEATTANKSAIQAAVAAQENAINNMSTTYNYTYTQYDATNYSQLGTATETVKGTSAGYMFTAPSVDGYAFLGAADPSTPTQLLDITKPITATNIVLLYSPILTDLANASSAKAYTMAAPRGYYNVESADASVFRATAGTPDYTDSNNYWTFVTVDGNTYLYNVTAGKFASTGAALVTSAPATLSAVSSGSSTNPLVLKMTEHGTTYTMNMDGNCNVFINDWATPDDGNMLQIAEIPGVTVTPDVYKVNFTSTTGSLTSVYVDGTKVALGTDVVLTSGATVSSSTTENFIESYNGFATLAEALADANFAGTVDVATSATLTTVTLNVTRDNRVVKTVTIENVPENDVITVADEVGVPNYVTALTPATITATDEDQTVNVTYTSTLPFTLSDDPTSANATAYLMTLRTTYAHGSNTSTTCDLGDDTYYWTFGGDEYNGITVYNKNNGYMNVANTDKSNATFSETPTVFYVSPNSKETNGFNLNIPQTNTYINRRDDLVSTWVSSAATNDAGSCLKVYTENEVVATLLPALQPYFTYAGCVNALTASAAAELNPTYTSFTQNPPQASEYIALKDAIDNSLVAATAGYYRIESAYDGFYTSQSVNKAMYYNTSNNTIGWTTVDGSASQVMKLTPVSGTSTFRLYAPLADVYLKKNIKTNLGATTNTEADKIAVEVLAATPGAVTLAYNPNGGNDSGLHANGHNTGTGVTGTLTGYTLTGAASLWRLYPLDIPEITLIEPNGVAKGDEVYQSFAYGSNKQLPLNVGVHYISTNSGNFAHIETVSSSAIRANEGYIIRGVKGATVPLLPIGEVDALSSTNLLVGVVEQTKVYSGYMLAYKGNDAEQKFYKIKNTGLTIPAYRSYLTAAAAANVRGLELLFGGIGDDEITGIDGINTGGTEGAIFDLQGRRVTKPEKGGIYIINGKKVMK